MKLPSKTMTSEHLPGATFTVELTHLHDDPMGPLVFEATISDGIVSASDRRDLAADHVGRDSIGQMGLDTLAGRAISSSAPVALAPAANLQQLVDAFRKAAVDRFAWKQAAKLIAPQIDLTPKSMTSNYVPSAKFNVDAKQIETEDGTLVFEIAAVSDLSDYREVQRH